MKTQGSLVACGDRLALDKPSIIVIEAEVSRPTVKTPSSWVPTQELEVFFSRSRLSLVYVSVGMSEAINRAKARCCLPSSGGSVMATDSAKRLDPFERRHATETRREEKRW